MCVGHDKNREHLVSQNEKHRNQYPNPGLNKQRKCRDIFCLLLLIIMWICNFVIAYFAFTSGDPFLFLYGNDYDGNVCGKNNTENPIIVEGLARKNVTAKDLTDETLQYFLTPFSGDFNFDTLPRVCLGECPSETSLDLADLICLDGYEKSYDYVIEGRCFFPYASTPVLNRCVPTVVPENITSIAIEELNSSEFITQLVASVYDTRFIILGATMATFVVGFLWLILMRFVAGVAIWTNVIGSILFILGFSLMLYTTSVQLETIYNERPANERLAVDESNYMFLRYTSYVTGGLGALFFLFTVFNSCNIQLAVAVAQEASKAFVSMPLLILFPIFPFFWFLCVFAFFVIVGVFIYSSTLNSIAYDANGTFLGYDSDNLIKVSGALHVFAFLWSTNFILAINQTVIAGAIADWYYSYRGKKQKKNPIWRSLWRTIGYSLGSLAFGSLIIAIVQFIRIFLKYIKTHLAGKDNRFTQCLYEALECCMECFERFIEYINKNAYIMISMYGYSFCVSAKRGFSIVISNPLKAATLQCISAYCLFLGKVTICMVITGGSFIFLSASAVTRMWAVPLIIIGIISYAIASMFMSIYDMAISTVLFCFLEDTFVNDGSRRQPYHCSKTLHALVDKNGFGPCCCCC
eukprot:TRINITY_DN791_c0_g1_i1.p1 TRINITY_DN791_c0_g1~~TRINITY_DN791_c0_g1_i1.p1  ORF type:complete len:636 (-),score=70.16 TRINITY_DN791_c0_g1_i1:19-1926(-)